MAISIEWNIIAKPSCWLLKYIFEWHISGFLFSLFRIPLYELRNGFKNCKDKVRTSNLKEMIFLIGKTVYSYWIMWLYKLMIPLYSVLAVKCISSRSSLKRKRKLLDFFPSWNIFYSRGTGMEVWDSVAISAAQVWHDLAVRFNFSALITTFGFYLYMSYAK